LSDPSVAEKSYKWAKGVLSWMISP
jgi:hypothetical protein